MQEFLWPRVYRTPAEIAAEEAAAARRAQVPRRATSPFATLTLAGRTWVHVSIPGNVVK